MYLLVVDDFADLGKPDELAMIGFGALTGRSMTSPANTFSIF